MMHLERKLFSTNATSLVLLLMAGLISTVILAAGPGQSQDYKTPKEIGGYFVDDYASVEPADFEPSLPKTQASEVALEYFMSGFDVPQGKGLEDLLEVKSTTGLFSGAKHGQGAWTVQDREVWVVVIDDLPFSLPCGPRRPTGEPCPYHPPRFNLAIDAETGEVLTTELTGAGPRSDKWRGFSGPSTDPNSLTPTPVPDEGDYCKRNPHNPNPIDPPAGGPTPTPVPDKDKACQ